MVFFVSVFVFYFLFIFVFFFGKHIAKYGKADCCKQYGNPCADIFFIYQINIPGGDWLVPVFGLLGGIFVGCWAMALAEMLNLFPVFLRRVKILRYVPHIILGIALGKGVGALLFFARGW